MIYAEEATTEDQIALQCHVKCRNDPTNQCGFAVAHSQSSGSSTCYYGRYDVDMTLVQSNPNLMRYATRNLSLYLVVVVVVIDVSILN